MRKEVSGLVRRVMEGVGGREDSGESRIVGGKEWVTV